MKQLGFKKTLILTMMVLAALVAGISSYFNYQSFSDDFSKQLYLDTQDRVKTVQEKLDDYIKTKARAVDKIAGQFEAQANAVNQLNDPHAQQDYMAHQAQLLKLAAGAGDIASLTIGYTNGDAWRSDDVAGWIDNKNPSFYNPTKRPWFAQARAASGIIYTAPFADATTKELMVGIGKRAGNDAVVLADIPLKILKSTVESFNHNGTIALIVGEDGTVLSASSSSIVQTGEKVGAVGSLLKIKNNIEQNGSIIYNYTVHGMDKVMFGEKIHYGNRHWYLMVGLNKAVVFQSLYKLRTESTILTLVCVVLSMIITTLIMSVLYRPILTLKDTILGLSNGNGDLTQRLEVTTNDDLGQMAEGINDFIAQLQDLMLQIEQVATNLGDNAIALTSSSDKNAQVLSKHVVETEQIVTAIEEMSATANTVAQNASESSESTQQVAAIGNTSLDVLQHAKESVEHLVTNVVNTSASMEEMTNETNNISKILEVIGDIAAQTNLLALNAAIEAARAGAQGRGFAVVADEVRALASRTQDSTVEIEQALSRLLDGNGKVISLMENTQHTSQQTQDGTEQVSATLNQLISQVMAIKDLSFQIATAAEEQSSVTQEVNQNMSALQDIVIELNANGETVVEQATSVSAINTQLLAIVRKFKLK